MNKLMIFPIAFMFLLTLISITYTGTTDTYQGTTGNYSTTGAYHQLGSDAKNGTVSIPSATPHTFSFWTSASGFLIIMTFALGIGVLSGIHFLGSGLSDTSQKMVFNAILFLGIWAALSVASSQFLFGISTITAFLWMILTLMYTIGLGIHMSAPVIS